MDENEKQEGTLSFSTVTLAIVLLVAILAGFLGIATAYLTHYNDSFFSAGTPLRTTDYRTIPVQWIGYQEKAVFYCSVTEPTAFAASPDGNWFIGSRKPAAVHCFYPDGKLVRTISLDDEPMCLAVGRKETSFADQLLVGSLSGLKIFDSNGKQLVDWQYPEDQRAVWSIVSTDRAVFAVDSKTGNLFSFDADGKIQNRFGSLTAPVSQKASQEADQKQDEESFPGFVVYRSPISMSFSPKTGLLYVTNPGRHHVEAFTQDGHWESSLSWGGASAGIVGFSGCCNPVDLDVLDDGRIVTAEKSVSRVKILRPDGKLDTVVAGPDVLEFKPNGIPELESVPNRSVSQNSDQPVMIAALKDDSILVFDPVLKIVRCFESKK